MPLRRRLLLALSTAPALAVTAHQFARRDRRGRHDADPSGAPIAVHTPQTQPARRRAAQRWACVFPCLSERLGLLSRRAAQIPRVGDYASDDSTSSGSSSPLLSAARDCILPSSGARAKRISK